MSLRELNDQSLIEVLKAPPTLAVVVCTSSDMPSPGFADACGELARQFHPDVRFYWIDLLENPSAQDSLRLKFVPSLILLVEGKEKQWFAGAECIGRMEQMLRELVRSKR